MKKLIVTAIMTLLLGAGVGMAQSRPTREVKMPTEGNLGINAKQYDLYQTGFFAAAEASGGYSLEIGGSKKNLGFTEIDFTGGYRVNDFLRAGIGLGARYYVGAGNLKQHDWGLPLFMNVRGNFIPNDYYNVVPFWSFDIGGTFPDGFMIRPTVGIRIGQPRSACVISIGYLGQNLRVRNDNNPGFFTHKYYNFITLKVGYEF